MRPAVTEGNRHACSDSSHKISHNASAIDRNQSEIVGLRGNIGSTSGVEAF
jgi:hypothetical protein